MMSVTVAAAMGAVVAAPMFQLTVAQAQSRAQLEARVLWQSEIERARHSGHLITTTLTLSTFLTTLNASKQLFTPTAMKDLPLTSNAQLVDKP